MNLALELFSADDGRVEGSVIYNPGGERVTFSGWLELLRLLEAALAASSAPPGGSRPLGA